MARLRVGVLGLNHDHVWGNLAALNDNELGQAVAAADPDLRLRERLAREHGGVEALASYDALLERADLDAVLIFADNRASAELGVRALGRGLPVMIEKPMAADLAGADALLAAARAAGLPLMVNWPTVWRPALRHGLTLVRSGAVGEPVQLSHRGGHAGPREYGCSRQFCEWLYDPARNGGGALVDYCGYGAILCRTVLVHQPKATREGEKAGAGRIQLITAEGSEWIDPPALPADERDGPSYFLSRIAAGRAVEGMCAPEIGRDAQEILAAALLSSASGREVTLPLTAS